MEKLPRGFQISVVAVILAAGLLMLFLTPQVRWEAWPELLLFVILIGLASMFPVSHPQGGYITATPILFYVLFSVHGPGTAMVIAGSSYVVGIAISRGWYPWRTLFNGAQIAISVALGGMVFRLLGGSVSKPDVSSFLIPFTLGALTHQMSNGFFVALLFSRLRGIALFSTWLSEMRGLLWANILGIPTAALIALLYAAVHPVVLLFYLASLPFERWALQLYLQQRRIYNQAIDALVVAIDADFPEGKGHSKRVAETAAAIARNLHVSDGDLENVEMGALLHDVGMIGLIDMVDPVQPTDSADSSGFREHVRLGAEVARQLPRRGRDIEAIVLYHHENYDGSGYPLGLKGSQIPLGARIVRVAEEYESMLASGLPSGQKLNHTQAVEIIRELEGKLFDPRVVEAFLSGLGQGTIPSVTSPMDTPTKGIISRSGAIS